MEGPLARDAANGVVSDSVKAVTERKANLDKQQDLRPRLQGCAGPDEVEGDAPRNAAARMSVLAPPSAAPREEGIVACMQGPTDSLAMVLSADDSNKLLAEEVLLTDGADCWTIASAMLEELQVKAVERAQAVTELEVQLTNLSLSADASAMESALVQVSIYSMQSELVDKLTQRAQTIQQQFPAHDTLKACLRTGAGRDEAQLSGTLKLAQEQGLDDATKWLLPEGPRVYANASLHCSS